MNCTECHEAISSYLDEELLAQLRAEVESHLASCPDRCLEVENWESCLSWLRRTFPEQMPPPDLRERIQAGAHSGPEPEE